MLKLDEVIGLLLNKMNRFFDYLMSALEKITEELINAISVMGQNLRFTVGEILNILNELFGVDLITVVSDGARIPVPERSTKEILERIVRETEARINVRDGPLDRTTATADSNRSVSSLIERQEEQWSPVSSYIYIIFIQSSRQPVPLIIN